MRAVTVHRVDSARRTNDPIGALLEKRGSERADNHHDLLRLARRLFAVDTADALHIYSDTGHLRRATLSELTGDCSGG